MSPSSVIFLPCFPHYGSSCLWAWWAVNDLLRKLIQICTLVEAKYLQMLHFNPFTVLVCKFFFYFVYLNSYYTNCHLFNWFSSFKGEKEIQLSMSIFHQMREREREREQVCTVSLLLIHLDFSVVSYFSTIVPPVLDRERWAIFPGWCSFSYPHARATPLSAVRTSSM